LLDVWYSISKNCCCCGGCCDCGGCSSELYWSEWHNDPPQCCDPCDRCGNWIGPGVGYRAPYAHPYSPTVGAYATKKSGSNQTTFASRSKSADGPARVARQPMPASGASRRR
jgi:hypothetical protein